MKPKPISRTDMLSLINEALAVRKFAYAPYSKFKVGAALLTGGGNIYTGVNIENAAFGESLCAEKVAVAQAVLAGDRDLRAIAVVNADGSPIMPCGACRQVINEFSPDCLIAASIKGKKVELVSAKDLLPGAFRLRSQ